MRAGRAALAALGLGAAACAASPEPSSDAAPAPASAVASAAIVASASATAAVEPVAPARPRPSELFDFMPDACPKGRIWVSSADLLAGDAGPSFDRALETVARKAAEGPDAQARVGSWLARLGAARLAPSRFVREVAVCTSAESEWVFAARLEEAPGGRPLDDTLLAVLPGWKRRDEGSLPVLEGPNSVLARPRPAIVVGAPTRAAALAAARGSGTRAFDPSAGLSAWADLPAGSGANDAPPTTLELASDVEGFRMKITLRAGDKAERLRQELEKMAPEWGRIGGQIPSLSAPLRVLAAANLHVAGEWLFVDVSFTRDDLRATLDGIPTFVESAKGFGGL